MNDDLIKRSDVYKAVDDWLDGKVPNLNIKDIPSADRPQGWVDKAISIIDDMQREGIIDYETAWEFRFEKAAFVNSDSQLYKQAGNSVTVNVVQAIAERLNE